MLRDNVAVVTGGAQGIGLAIVKRFISEGTSVVIADVNIEAATKAAAECDSSGDRTLVHHIDLLDLDQIPTLIQQTLQKFGRLDVLVNNAGVETGGTFFEVTPGGWDLQMDINLRAMFFTTQAAAAWMKDHGGGAVVNIASIQGGTIFSERFIPYTVSKAGVRALTSATAVALAPFAIRVNAVAPSWCDTPMSKVGNDKEAFEARLKIIPLHRVGQPSEVADAVLFLASSQAAYITGQTLTIDGGRTVAAGQFAPKQVSGIVAT
jgi:NAD(P)-dependent dehydrogenase (short-subunit alcohol dehydrogenase family)